MSQTDAANDNGKQTPMRVSPPILGDLFMTFTMKHLRSLLSDESGQDLIEYALAASLIGLAAVTAVRGLATHIASAFTSIGTSLTTAV